MAFIRCRRGPSELRRIEEVSRGGDWGGREVKQLEVALASRNFSLRWPLNCGISVVLIAAVNSQESFPG